jgi:hypothetical protein
MTESNNDQLNKLKELFETGAISKMEFDEMKQEFIQESLAKDGVKSARKKKGLAKFVSKNKKLLIWSLVGLILLLFIIWFLQPNLEKESENLAQICIKCHSNNNEELKKELNLFINEFDSKGYKFSSQVDEELSIIDSKYQEYKLSPEVTTCFQNFEEEKSKMLKRWEPNNEAGAKFWGNMESLVSNNGDLKIQLDEIRNLRLKIDEKRNSLHFENSESINDRKNSVYSTLNSFYSNKESGYFDAYNYFTYNVDQYLTSKKLSPTDINLINSKQNDYIDKTTKVIEETLHIKEVKDEIETWTYSTEFKAFRPSLEKFQICNVWFEIKINNKLKINSYKEIKTENKRLLSAEEYNNLFNNNSYGSEEADW